MTDIEWIIFSKYRTLQLKSCIISLTSLSDVTPEEITVLYVDSDAVSYEPLKKQLPCRFIRQTDFYQNLMDILHGTSKPLVCFLVDDLIFRDRFSSAQIENLMARYEDLDCFSFRLGKNIKDGRAPEFEELEPGILAWKTAKGLGNSWNYFWENSSSIYRKEFVVDFMRRLPRKKITYPNPKEFYYYRIMPNFVTGSRGILRALAQPRCLLWPLFCPQKRVKGMACYEKSRAFTQGVNLVANMKGGPKTYITPEKLHELFLEGYQIDFECLRGVDNKRPNAGRKYFRLVGPNGEVHSLSVF